ncbi:MAG: 30S ribosomal protein S20 [Acidimicrobiia bacterium]
MANIRSQIKRNRQNTKRRLRNMSIRSELKSRARAALDAAEAGDTATALDALRMAQKRIDMATAKGVLHPKTAGRRKARLMRQVNGFLEGGEA